MSTSRLLAVVSAIVGQLWTSFRLLTAVSAIAHIPDELRKSPNAVPIFRRKPAYRVVQSSMVNPLATSSTGMTVCPATLRPINFILMQSLKEDRAGGCFAEFICSSFDVSQCAVSLTVEEDHLYVFTGSDDTFSCLDEGRLTVHPASFGSTVESQMQRVEKYLLRGFKW